MSSKIRVFVLHHDPLIRNFIHSLLTTAKDLQIVGETANVSLLPDLCRDQKPHILLTGGGNPSLFHELALLTHGYTPEIRLIALLRPEDIPHFPVLLATPLHGGCLEAEINATLSHILRAVAGGATCFSRAVFAPHLPFAATNRLALLAQVKLTGQEQRVLALLSQGLDNDRIATELKLAEQTVRNYVKNIYGKFAIHNRAELVARLHQMSVAQTEQ